MAKQAPVAQESVADDFTMLQGSQVMSDDDVAGMMEKMSEGVPAEPVAEPVAEVAETVVEDAETVTEVVEEEEEVSPHDQDPATIAENKRLRAKNRDLNEETQKLREDMARTNGRLDELSKQETGGQQTVDQQIRSATEEGLLAAKQNLELKMFEASQEGNRETYERLVAGKGLVEKEIMTRQTAMIQDQSVPNAQSQFVKVRDQLTERHPDVLREGSPFQKAIQTFMNDNQALMKQLGPLGELMAISSVIGLQPEIMSKTSGNVAKKIETGIQQVVQNAVGHRGSSATPVTSPAVAVPTSIDGMNEMAEKMKRGEFTLSQLG